MKKLLLIIACIALMPIISHAQEVKKAAYVVFDGLEDGYDYFNDNGPVSTDIVGKFYYDVLKSYPRFAPYTVRLPFNSETFDEYDAEDFDLAIFPMGSYGLGDEVDGIRIWDIIQEMLDNGKKVYITGSHIIQNTSYSQAKFFIESTCGIDFNNPLPLTTTSGNSTTYYGFTTGRIMGDIISNASTQKNYNITTTGPDNIEYPPTRRLDEIEGFEMFNNAKAIPFAPITPRAQTENAYIKMPENHYVAVRVVTAAKGIDTSKVIMYTIPHDIVSDYYYDNYTLEFMRGINWLMDDVPFPEQYARLDPGDIDFEFVTPLTIKQMSVDIVNYGREPLTVNDFYLNDPDKDPGSFTIYKPDFPITIDPLDSYTMQVEFAPDREKSYFNTYTLVSNGINGNVSGVIRGSGVEDAQGSKLYMERDPLNYGSVVLGRSKDYDIIVDNIGVVSMAVETWTELENDDNAFRIPVEFATPFVIPAGERHIIPMRFVPVDKKEYKAKFKIKTNALNYLHNAEQLGLQRGEWIIEMSGRGVEQGTDAKISTGQTEINFGEVEGSATLSLNLTNIGGRDLRIFGIEVGGSPEAAKQFSVAQKPSFSEPIIIGIGQSSSIDITFNPENKKLYDATLTILSNTEGGAPLQIALSGIGASEGAIIQIINDVVFFNTFEPTRNFNIFNVGDLDLQIDEIYLTGADSENFSLIYNEELPTVVPGDLFPVQITFDSKGEVKNFEAEMVIVSNANGQEELSIDLRAILTSVNETTLDLAGGDMTMEINPNPISSSAEFSFYNNTNNILRSRIFIADITGKVLADLDFNTINAGESIISYDASELSNGTYYLVAEVDGKLATVPFLVAK